MIYSMGKNNHDNSSWTARAASNDIYRILESNPTGCVHSIFTNSFNLYFGGHLVHVGAAENGLSPFGIGLDQNDVQQLLRRINGKQTVVWDSSSNTLIFSEGASLSLEQAELTTHTINGSMCNLPHLKDNFLFVADRLRQEEWRTGLVETNEDKIVLIKYLLDPVFDQKDTVFLNKLDTLKKLARGDQTVEAESVFNYWIGRGLGLTPSGDDVITGICAIFSALKGTNKAFQEQLRSYLVEYGRERTTHIALEYLLYATENKFHSHLIQMCHVMDKPRGPEFLAALEEIRKIGHTSGADTIIGILLGINALDI
ncbi:hypothetical protein AM500_03290 [Bacillus sp. FJAT-18017]|uniref:DUF2877 domain-containing protein n=1 Tax=Bacillus sp. FJAT-18017 TaxID=1705566 RepID=UPI0006AF6CCB|nr:DUF2877 domain-containing protein [Bacillus sp. FJAT-18017]ALC88932.1 hypothetical protein AM500_03290 [Bacillus sp. FJAT-18017]